MENTIMLVEEFVNNQWLPSCQGLRECTLVGYKSTLNRYILPTFKTVELNTITVDQIELWIATIPSQGAARKAWAVLRSILRKALRWGLIDRDITIQVTPIKRSEYQPQVLNTTQIRQLLQGFYGHPLEAWLICSTTLGLRTEEALGLEWNDINLTTGHVRIQRGLQWVNGHEQTVKPKTELSRRTVVLPRFAILRLRQLKNKGRLIGSLNPNQVDRRYRTWCHQHNLPCVPRRNLRHSWATTALAAGVDVAVVSRALGHSSIETTARYYLRPDLDVLKEAQRQWANTIMHK